MGCTSADTIWRGSFLFGPPHTNKVNIPDLQNKLQRRADMITETAKRLSEFGLSQE